jgi:hypothetical protein
VIAGPTSLHVGPALIVTPLRRVFLFGGDARLGGRAKVTGALAFRRSFLRIRKATPYADALVLLHQASLKFSKLWLSYAIFSEARLYQLG